jgi:hypothetical protein
MLAFERDVVASLVTSPEPALRSAVVASVDRSLRSMPEHLRAAVAAESLVLGAWVRAVRSIGTGRDDLAAQLDGWEASRVGPIRQYVRLFRSLVLFAECELAPASR